MAHTAPTTALRGRLASYDCADLDRIDRHLREMAAYWRCIRQPTQVQQGDYWADVDMLLDRRGELA